MGCERYKNIWYKPRAYTSKKGRTWKRYCDVLIAWKTIRARLREDYNMEHLIDEYRIQRFELTLTDTLEPNEVLDDIKEREIKYEARKLQDKIWSLEYRIASSKRDADRYSAQIPELEKELEKLRKKVK